MLVVVIVVPADNLLSLSLCYRCSPLQADERLFIEAIRDLNRQASRLQAEENLSMLTKVESVNGWIVIDNAASSNSADSISMSTSTGTSHSDAGARPTCSADFTSSSSLSPI
jgi:hypothetical protein